MGVNIAPVAPAAPKVLPPEVLAARELKEVPRSTRSASRRSSVKI